MTVYRLGEELVFPDPEEAGPEGLLAVGGDLRPERLLLAYSEGIFPWYDEPPILWFSPDPRLVLLPKELRVSRRLRRTLRQGRFELRFDTAFDAVIRACAETERPGQDGTWINPEMIDAYCELHRLGFAHSSEAWCEGELAGGVYGLSIGRGFFGESMFFRRRDASKAALVALVWQLDAWGLDLLDCQLPNPHLLSLGAREWPRSRFLAWLRDAVRAPTRRGQWRFAPDILADRL